MAEKFPGNCSTLVLHKHKGSHFHGVGLTGRLSFGSLEPLVGKQCRSINFDRPSLEEAVPGVRAHLATRENSPLDPARRVAIENGPATGLVSRFRLISIPPLDDLVTFS